MKTHGKLSHAGIHSTQIRTSPAVTKMLIRETGIRYFQQKAMIWSMRTRTSVARSHKMNMNTRKSLVTNTSQAGIQSAGSGHACQPPRNRVAVMVATARVFTYSPRKKVANFMPEYSVKYPVVNSDSASI